MKIYGIVKVSIDLVCYSLTFGNSWICSFWPLEAADVAKEQWDALKRYNPSKLDTVEVDRIMAKYFDMSCDLCENSYEANSLQQAQHHYMQVHQVPDGYIKCCGLHFKTKYGILEHIPYHMDESAFR